MCTYICMLSLEVNKRLPTAQNQALILHCFISHHLSVCKAEFKMLCWFGNSPSALICTGEVKQRRIRTWNFRVCQFRKLSDRNICPSAPMWEWTWITNPKLYLHCGLLFYSLGCTNPVQGQGSLRSKVWMKAISSLVKWLVRGYQRERDDSNPCFLKNAQSSFAGQTKDNNKPLGAVPWPPCPGVSEYIFLVYKYHNSWGKDFQTEYQTL